SLPRYFLIVFALAGDSTMIRLSAIERSPQREGFQCGAPVRVDTRSSRRWNAASCPGWLDNTMSTTHFNCSVSSSSASRASMRSMTISRCHADRIPRRCNVNRNPRHSVDNRASSPSLKMRTAVPAGPCSRASVERSLYVRLRKAGTFEVARQMLSFGHFRYLIEHVAIENVDQDVENAAGHHHLM